MKKKIIVAILSGAMLTGIFTAATLAAAEETPEPETEVSVGGLLSSLFSGGGLEEILGSLSEEGEGLGEMAEGIVGSLSEDEELSGLISELKEKYGDIDLNTLLSGDGSLAQLLGENGEELARLLGENGEELAQLLGENGEELAQLLGENGEELAQLLSEDGEGLGSLIGSLIGGSVSGESYSDPSVVFDDYAKDRAANFAPCDVTFQVPMVAGGGLDENGVSTFLGVFWVFNYDIEEDHLVFASGSGDAALITATPQEDGTYRYTADEAVDGEGYADDIARLCEALGSGITADEFFKATDNEEERDILLLTKFIEYAEEHPEITAIDLNGEMVTVEQASLMIDDYFAQLLSGLEGLYETEEETEII